MRQSHENVIDRLLLDHPLGVIETPEAFQILQKIVAAVAQIAGDAEAELVVRAHALDDRTGQLAVSRDQDAIETLPRSMAPLHCKSNDASAEDDE